MASGLGEAGWTGVVSVMFPAGSCSSSELELSIWVRMFERLCTRVWFNSTKPSFEKR